MIKDVTEQVDWMSAESERLPLLNCVCGKRFGYWEFHISVYENSPTACPKCGRKLFWEVRVYEVIDDVKA